MELVVIGNLLIVACEEQDATRQHQGCRQDDTGPEHHADNFIQPFVIHFHRRPGDSSVDHFDCQNPDHSGKQVTQCLHRRTG